MRLFRVLSASDVISILLRHYMPYNQPCGCKHMEAVEGLVTLYKPTRQSGRSPYGSTDDIVFSFS